MPHDLKCQVCEKLSPEQLAELNVLMGDPQRWPKTLFADSGFEKPVGMPPRYRTWGAVAMGKAYLSKIGSEISGTTLENHYRNHIPIIAASARDLAESGLVASQPEGTLEYNALDPTVFPMYYQKGVEVATKALGILERRVDKIIADPEQGEDQVPTELLKLLSDIGTKLALSAGAITAKGGRIGPKQGHDAARRAAGGSKIGEKVAGHRLRVVSGESRPVLDRGMADRDAYNDRAKREGLDGL